jgi:hypothetical protein
MPSFATVRVDLRAGLHAKRWFDAVGHYSLADIPVAPEDETAPA